MGRIYRPAPSRAARLNDYRWQDDPEAGEFSDYLRDSHIAPVLTAVAAIVVAIGLAVLLARCLFGL